MESRLAVDLAHAIVPLQSGVYDDAALFEIISRATVVFIGGATQGTHEFFRARAEITKRLIADYGCTAVCIEGDWPAAERVNRYVRGASDDAEAIESLEGFKRYPAWMWRNAEVLDFVAWLREYNDAAPRRGRSKVGFYGLDIYSMYASIDAVLSSLDRVDPEAAARARRSNDVVAELLEIRRQAARDEREYRAMLDESVSAWKLRDAHMLDALERLMKPASKNQGITKAVVWAHNSRVGDAEATSMALRNETNIGALARLRFGDDAVSIGFTTYVGTVTAASEWHGAPERKRIVPACGDSYEYLFHSMNVPRFLVPLRPHRPKLSGLPAQARERAIGAIYRPQTELDSHYFTARLVHQFDALYHFDVTRAAEPLEGYSTG